MKSTQKSNVVKLVSSKTGRGAKRSTLSREYVYDAWTQSEGDLSLEQIHQLILQNSVDDKGHSDMLPQIRVPQGFMGQIDEICRFFGDFRSPQDFVRTAIHRQLVYYHQELKRLADQEDPVWVHAWNATTSLIALSEFEQKLVRSEQALGVLSRVKGVVQQQVDMGAMSTARELALDFESDVVSVFEEFGGIDQGVVEAMREYVDTILALTKSAAKPKARPKKGRISKKVKR